MQQRESTAAGIGGLELFSQSWLPDAPAHAAVAIAHGLGEHSGRYAHVAAALVDRGYSVRALDHRGHGRSQGKRVFVKEYAEFQRDLLQFRRLVGAEHPDAPLHVFGHSMGCHLALRHVLDHPQAVRGPPPSRAALPVAGAVDPGAQTIAGLPA